MPSEKLLKAIRITCIVLFVLCPLCWLALNAATWAFFTDTSGSTLQAIIDALIIFAYRHLPVPALLCSFAAYLLAKKNPITKKRTIAAGVLVLVAIGFMAFPLAITLIMLLPR